MVTNIKGIGIGNVTRHRKRKRGRRGNKSPVQLQLDFRGGVGISKTPAGHLRYTSPAALRGKYVHREVVRKLVEETPYSIRLLLPQPWEVHHMDYDKGNNTPGNLLLVEEAFHAVLTAAGRGRRRDGRWVRKFWPRWKWDYGIGDGGGGDVVGDVVEPVENCA